MALCGWGEMLSVNCQRLENVWHFKNHFHIMDYLLHSVIISMMLHELWAHLHVLKHSELLLWCSASCGQPKTTQCTPYWKTLQNNLYQDAIFTNLFSFMNKSSSAQCYVPGSFKGGNMRKVEGKQNFSKTNTTQQTHNQKYMSICTQTAAFKIKKQETAHMNLVFQDIN